MYIFVFLLLVQVPTPNLNAPEYGKLEEIKGKINVYVISEDTRARDIVVKELGKAKKFNVVESPEKADFGILFDMGQSRAGFNTFVFTGQLVVFVKPKEDPNPEKPRIRIVWSVQKIRAYGGGITLNRHPATNATREFVKKMKELK